MANQLCHSAETNHCIAESITVSHGNTLPQVSLFIKAGSAPPPHLRRAAWVFGVRTLALRVARVADVFAWRYLTWTDPRPRGKPSSTGVETDGDSRLTKPTTTTTTTKSWSRGGGYHTPLEHSDTIQYQYLCFPLSPRLVPKQWMQILCFISEPHFTSQ